MLEYTPINQTLVIHPPGDDTTHFLHPIYSQFEYKAVDLEGDALLDHLRDHRVVAMGHGTGFGLFDAEYNRVLDEAHVAALRQHENVFIWCYASDFLKRNDLNGFATGMFISEAREAEYFNIESDDASIDDSNELFVDILRTCLVSPAREIFDRVMNDYKIEGNRVVDYNRDGMYVS